MRRWAGLDRAFLFGAGHGPAFGARQASADVTITLVQTTGAQEGGGAGSETITVTPTSTPTSGSLLVVSVRWNGITHVITPPAGWTLAVETINAHQQQLWYRIAGAAEPGSYVWTSTSTGVRNHQFREWSSSTGWVAVPLDKTSSGFTVTAATSVQPGSTLALAQADELAVSVCHTQSATSAQAVDSEFTADTSQNRANYAYRIVTTTDPLNPTFTWADLLDATATIATFMVGPV